MSHSVKAKARAKRDFTERYFTQGTVDFNSYKAQYAKKFLNEISLYDRFLQASSQLPSSPHLETQRTNARRARKAFLKAAKADNCANISIVTTTSLSVTARSSIPTFVPVVSGETKEPAKNDSLSETTKCLIRDWPFTQTEVSQFKRVILGDVDGGMAPIHCSLVLHRSTCCIGAFGTVCPTIVNERNAANSFLKLVTAGNKKEAADGFLISIGHQLHGLLPLDVPFLIIAGYPKSCVAPWIAAGRAVTQFSPKKYKQFRDLGYCEQFLMDEAECLRGSTTTPSVTPGTKPQTEEILENKDKSSLAIELEPEPKRKKVEITPAIAPSVTQGTKRTRIQALEEEENENKAKRPKVDTTLEEAEENENKTKRPKVDTPLEQEENENKAKRPKVDTPPATPAQPSFVENILRKFW